MPPFSSPAERQRNFEPSSLFTDVVLVKNRRICVGYVWTGKSDMNTDTCGRGYFLIWVEETADSKVSRYVWTGPKTAMFVALEHDCFLAIVTGIWQPCMTGTAG